MPARNAVCNLSHVVFYAALQGNIAIGFLQFTLTEDTRGEVHQINRYVEIYTLADPWYKWLQFLQVIVFIGVTKPLVHIHW